MTNGDALWPAKNSQYAAARARLTEAEQEVGRAIEEVAERRRALPLGSRVRDYAFLEGSRDVFADDHPSEVRMAELFGPHRSLALYSFMFDGSTDQPCPMCTSLIDGYDGAAADLTQRVGFAIIAPAPLDRLRAYGRQRRWRNLRLLADPHGTYSRDSGALTADGELRSLMTVFTRQDHQIRHFYTAKSRRAPRARTTAIWTRHGRCGECST